MKRLMLAFTILCSILITQSGYSADTMMRNQQPQTQMMTGQSQGGQMMMNRGDMMYNRNDMGGGDMNGGQVIYDNEYREDHACGEQNTGDCWCKFVRYKPCYYTTTRCIEEQVPCYKKCCRYVPQNYEVQRCRYVPQYYTETCCRQVPEYYDVCEYKCCKKYVCDKHCKYVPEYYWKHVCPPAANCNTPCPR